MLGDTQPRLFPTIEESTYEGEETKLAVDASCRYSVWVSYVEVYMEKIFDLLDAAPDTPTEATGMTPSRSGMVRSGSRMGSSWSISNLAGLANGGSKATVLERKPLSLKNDPEGGKYIDGAREVRVRSAAEARALAARGSENRVVFGTLANRASSRSHGIFTVRLLRESASAPGDESHCSTARLNIVDLAGSERLANTGAIGDRLKEAANINKGLSCLQSCLNAMRSNRRRVAAFATASQQPAAGAAPGSVAAQVRRLGANRRPSVVPFNQSKLTSIFGSYFTGEGRTAIIVNVNPYGTSFDENCNVLRLGTDAQEVATQTGKIHMRVVHPSIRALMPQLGAPRASEAGSEESGSATPRRGGMGSNIPAPAAKFPATPRSAAAAADLQRREAAAQVSLRATPEEDMDVTILEGDEATDDEDEDESNPFVEMLMQQHEELRQRVSCCAVYGASPPTDPVVAALRRRDALRADRDGGAGRDVRRDGGASARDGGDVLRAAAERRECLC
jgi:kinesin family protein 20/kinesin family protein 23